MFKGKCVEHHIVLPHLRKLKLQLLRGRRVKKMLLIRNAESCLAGVALSQQKTSVKFRNLLLLPQDLFDMRVGICVCVCVCVYLSVQGRP